MSVLATFNPGSSTIKIGLFAVDGPTLTRLGKAMVDFRQAPLTLKVEEGGSKLDVPLKAAADDFDAAIDETLGWLAGHFQHDEIVAVGHRVVHGGEHFAGPVRIDDDTLAAIEALVPLAPLHQPYAVRLIRAVARRRPSLAQIASFDTAFHRTQADLVRRLALPRALFDQGIKRYGFHGLSYKYVAAALQRDMPQLAQGRVVVAHLGSGASLCALEGGISRDTSMGFSTLDGIPMATRCGALDPGVALHLLRNGTSPAELEDMLYRRSGLLGLSGLSADSRTLLESALPEASEALAAFALRIAQTVTSLAVTMGGLDGVVFTAGIGEHQPPIRAAVAARLAWLGAAIDPLANAANAAILEAPSSRIAFRVIATDEEQVIAEEALGLLGS